MAETKTRMTFEEIMEGSPKAWAKVEALRKAIADAEGLGESQLVDSLRLNFNVACEESARIMVDTINLPSDQRRAVCASMEERRKAAA
jgi:hypothetical protein